MDPLSITASVIAVATLCGQVVSICYEYQSGVKNASNDMIRITDEITNLRNVLESILKIASEAQNMDPPNTTKLSTLGLLIQPEGPLIKCEAELTILKKRLEPETGLKAIGKALSWPLRERETKKTLDKIASFKSILTLALTADHTTMMLALQDDITALNQAFASAKLDEHREKIHRWLLSPDPSSNFNAALKKRQLNTGQWFVQGEEYARWKTNSNSFVWLHGIPGCGKTVLCSTIIQDMISHCQSDATIALVYFYFDFSDLNKQKIDNLLHSLVTQIASQCSKNPEAIQTLYSSCQNGHRQPSKTDLLVAFQHISREFDKTFIILDALDECGERDELLQMITEVVQWKEKICLLTTSRKERDIDECLEPLVTSQICIQSKLVNADIHAHVNNVLQNDPKLKKWPVNVQTEIHDSLMNGANGMFRWVACQLDAIRKCLKIGVLRNTLKKLPKTLNDTYERILCNIEEDYSQDALKVFQWLAFSARPLSIDEVAEVIGIDIDARPRYDSERKLSEPRDILTICSSMVVLSKTDEAEELKLSHFSVKEYLISNSIRNGPASLYSISEISANGFIAKAALGYLLQFDKPDSVTLQTFQTSPLSRYAAEHWAQHARIAAEDSDTSSIDSLSLELFIIDENPFINWIRLFRPEDSWDDSIAIGDLGDKIASPLYYASSAGLVGLAAILLEKGADVNLQGGRFGSALQAASFRGHETMIKLLLAEGADVNLQGGHFGTALQAASFGGHETVIKLLLAEGADVNLQGGHFGSALQAASYEGHETVIKLLLAEEADVNLQGGLCGTALQAASFKGHETMIKLLLAEGADVNLQGGLCGSALQAASLKGHETMIKLLLAEGADINLQGGAFGTALETALAGGNKAAAQVLRAAGAKE